MLLRIVSVKYLDGYRLNIQFNDNKTKIVDFENWIKSGKGYFLPLKNIEYFKKVKLDKFNYSVCWPNGADFSPDVLYALGRDTKNVTPKGKKRLTTSIMRSKRSLVPDNK
jgi:hypothetical protein